MVASILSADAGRASDKLLGTLQLLILKTLDHGPNHGFGITLHIQTVSDGMLRVEEGSLYPALHRLERAKLIVGKWIVTGNGRRARVYTLSNAGKKRLAEAENNWATVSAGVQKVLEFA
jgi:PadR family transcriptional regulator, regulatory protein PadR